MSASGVWPSVLSLKNLKVLSRAVNKGVQPVTPVMAELFDRPLMLHVRVNWPVADTVHP